MAKQYLDHPQLKSKCSFPVPAKTSFRDGKRSQDAVLGFEYCESLTPELAAIMSCRIYRLDPPIDMKKIGETSTTIDIWEGPLTFKAEEYETAFYHKYGAGAYKVIVEEQGLSGRVCDIWFTLTDREGYPPKIDDRTLCFDKPAAKDYIDWRFRRGEPVQGIEPENNKGEDELFMEQGKAGSGSAVAAVVDGFTNLATTLVSDAKAEAREAKLEAKEARETRTASTPTTDTVTHAAAEGIKLMGDVTREVMKNSNAPDPVEMFKSFAALMPPPPDPTPMFNTILTVVQESNKTMMQMVMNQNSELKNELNSLRNSSTALATQPKSATDQLREIRDNAELLGYTRNGAAERASATPAKSVFEEWGPIIQMGLQIFSPLLNALTVKLAGTNGAPNPAQPGVTQPGAAPNPQPQAPPPDSPQARTLAFLKSIEPSFMSHLMTPDCNGFTFAAHVLSGGTGGMETVQGRASYNWIKTNYGFRPDRTCGLDALIRTYEPIWNTIEKDLPKYQKFLSEFLNYDEQVGASAS